MVCIILMLVSGYSYSIQPVEGMWYDPNASGRGATIEIQNGVMIVTYFGYGPDQSDRWWQGVATETSFRSDVYTGELNAFENGQCVGCSYQAPELNSGSSLGGFSITFTTWKTAVLQWAGGTDNLVKLDYGYSGQESYLYGSWFVSAFFSDGPSNGEEVLSFFDTFEDNGNEYVVGNKIGYVGSADYLALANTADVNGVEHVLILLDSSSSFYRSYLFVINENKASGRSWLYLKSSSPSGDGYLAAGARLLDAYESNVSVNKNSKNMDDYYEQLNQLLYNTREQQTEKTIEPELAEAFQALQNKLESLR